MSLFGLRKREWLGALLLVDLPEMMMMKITGTGKMSGLSGLEADTESSEELLSTVLLTSLREKPAEIREDTMCADS